MNETIGLQGKTWCDFINALKSSEGAANAAFPKAGPLGYMSFILFYFFIILLINAATGVAKTLSGTAGQMAMKYGGMAAGAAMGTGAAAWRRTGGKIGAAYQGDSRLKDMQASKNIFARTFAKGALATAGVAAKGTGDIRNIPGFAKAAKTSGIDTGRPSYGKGGYAAIQEKKVKKREEAMKGMSESAKEAYAQRLVSGRQGIWGKVMKSRGDTTAGQSTLNKLELKRMPSADALNKQKSAATQLHAEKKAAGDISGAQKAIDEITKIEAQIARRQALEGKTSDKPLSEENIAKRVAGMMKDNP
jgi:hypothetical protein